MPPLARRLMLTIHVTSSVAWIGGVAAFLTLAVAGAVSDDAAVAAAASIGMSLVGWWVIVPLSLVSAMSGFVQSIGTSWGVVRHYWILIKVAITLPSVGLLFLHMGPADRLAAMAREMPLSIDTTEGLWGQLMLEAGAAMAVLVVATVLSLYKPRGLTPFGRRRLAPGGAAPDGDASVRSGPAAPGERWFTG